MLKNISIFILSIFFLIFALLFFDMTSYDSSYINRNATVGNLIFASGTEDKKIRTFDSLSGEELWSYKLPFIDTASPSIYMVDNKQYILIPAFDYQNNEDAPQAFSIE